MKEKIYTIPVTEAFQQECECPVCVLERKLENEYTGYYLGPALMEPDCRVETNKKGFCRRHFEMLYNRQENRLGLGLETDTHLKEQLHKLSELSQELNASLEGSKASKPLFGALSSRLSVKSQTGGSPVPKVLELLAELEKSCAVCDKLQQTMERYVDVIFYLWSQEEDFRKLFKSKKGFCLPHLKRLVETAPKYLKPDESNRFVALLLRQQVENLDRLEKELDWFTKKFDYRFNDAPWGNSKDALPRSIEKLRSYSDLR